MNKTIGILGLGIFGSTIAKTLSEYDYDVIAIDREEANVNRLEPYVTTGVIGDITDVELLESVGIGDCEHVVIATGTVLEASILALMHCKNLGVKHIVAKAKNNLYRQVLEEMGADIVILPEKETGIRIAKNLMRNKIEDIVELDDTISIVEFFPPKKWLGKTLQELDLRNEYDMNIIGMRESRTARLNVNVAADTIVRENLVFVAITESDVFEHHDYLSDSSK